MGVVDIKTQLVRREGVAELRLMQRRRSDVNEWFVIASFCRGEDVREHPLFLALKLPREGERPPLLRLVEALRTGAGAGAGACAGANLDLDDDELLPVAAVLQLQGIELEAKGIFDELWWEHDFARIADVATKAAVVRAYMRTRPVLYRLPLENLLRPDDAARMCRELDGLHDAAMDALLDDDRTTAHDIDDALRDTYCMSQRVASDSLLAKVRNFYVYEMRSVGCALVARLLSREIATMAAAGLPVELVRRVLGFMVPGGV